MPNHFIKLWKRGLALLLAGVLLFSNLSGSLAFAESTPSQETTTATSETAETAAEGALSEQAQAFVDAVAAMDRDSMGSILSLSPPSRKTCSNAIPLVLRWTALLRRASCASPTEV